ncbi:MAG: NAD(P)H-hydrate dehydratase [Thermodesulfobacteriota bacterium]
MTDPLLISPLPTPAEMNGWDRSAAAMGLKTELLMENASREALHALEEKLGELRGKSAMCFAGPGNNGGDAIALARHLHDSGVETTLLLARPSRSYKGAPGFHLKLARRAGVHVDLIARTDLERLPEPDIVVDGLLGTGLKGEPRPEYAAHIDALNLLGERSFVLALDIPSGLDGETGVAARATVIADMTVTFEAAKLGLCLPEASGYVGELVARRIGIPRIIREERPASHYLMTPELAFMLPGLDAGMHKGSAGKVLIIGGSPGLTGAPVLAALGALRSGAGLVTVACPAGIEPALKAGNPDVMTLPLGHGERWSASMAQALRTRMSDFDALVVGPGMGRGQDAAEFLSALGTDLPPSVWDADALFWLASKPVRLKDAVATPHPGEAARILGKTIPEVEASRASCVRELALAMGSTVALKGPGTLVCPAAGVEGAPPSASPPVFVSPFSEPNLAVGGSGDVLSGVAGSLLARDLSPLLAACLGVYWHGLAGRLVSGDFPYRGNLASEIAGALPRALTEWLHADS